MSKFITKEEELVLDKLKDAWENYLKLEVQHPNERDEFAESIHGCQHLISIRIARKAVPERFPTHKVKSNG